MHLQITLGRLHVEHIVHAIRIVVRNLFGDVESLLQEIDAIISLRVQ